MDCCAAQGPESGRWLELAARTVLFNARGDLQLASANLNVAALEVVVGFVPFGSAADALVNKGDVGEAAVEVLVEVGPGMLLNKLGDIAKGAGKLDNAAGAVARNVPDALKQAEVLQVSVPGRTSVYSAVEDGVVRYVGITDDLPSRAATHFREKAITVNEIPGLSGLARTDARSVEQALIIHHGLGKNGGTLMNKIDSIARSNPI